MKNSAEIRTGFLRFFESKGHRIVPGSSLIPGNDPTLLFTNAGMVQFKDVFLGTEKRDYSRATTVQKCMRVAGKHNDLEIVGLSLRHHTFFEMLGNFSFGDYFKREAIAYAWELLTQNMGLDAQRLYPTIYQEDDEAFGLWQEIVGMPAERISRLGKKDNFWEMGDTGPCGPTSEIMYDRGREHCTCGLPNCTPTTASTRDCERWWELWNLVFMQFNRGADGSLTPLPKPGVDTGMGFERTTAVLQGVDNDYATDLFVPMMERTQELLGDSSAAREAKLVGYRVIADHSRAIAFLIADGVLPGNIGRSYVLRLILRRAARYGRLMGFRRVFLPEIVRVVIENMGLHYQELRQRRDFILQAVAQEEERFLQTLDTGLSLFDNLASRLQAQGISVIPGQEAFRLYDTYGFPLDLTKDVAKERKMTVDEEGYRAALEEQRARARAAQHFELDEEAEIYRQLDLPPTTFLGYEHLSASGEVISLLSGGEVISEAHAGQQVQVVLNKTPFYGASGGQVGDSGAIEGPAGRIEVTDVRHPLPNLTVHYSRVVTGKVTVGDPVTAQVDRERRLDIARNHTATHLLHRALRQVLGDHARQAGSLVAPDRLRFDFTQLSAMTTEQLEQVQALVNARIRDDIPVNTRMTSYREALDSGAVALFGEKYGDVVRQVTMGEFTSELCGGTHLHSTGQIGTFWILSESSIGAGLRRIEAVTGHGAEEYLRRQTVSLAEAAEVVEAKPGELAQKVRGLIEQLREQQREIESLRRELAQREVEKLLAKAQDVAEPGSASIRTLAVRVEAVDMNGLREMADMFRNCLGSAAVVLGAVINEKPALVATATPDLVEQGIDAAKLIQAVAKVVGGGGGGRPTMAQAGGKDASKLDEALALVPKLVKEMAKRD